MPIINRIAALSDEMAAWRHDFHENPELLYEVHRTAGIVADKLREFGCDEVVTGIGRTGVVGVIRGRKSASGKAIGLRADMDALPIVETADVPYASKIVNALQSIVARNVDPLKSAVISVTQFHAGTAFNIIPETAELSGTVRTLDPEVRDLVERRIGEVAESVARAYGGSAETKYTRMYPVTTNHAREAGVAAGVARDIVGAERVNEK